MAWDRVLVDVLNARRAHGCPLESLVLCAPGRKALESGDYMRLIPHVQKLERRDERVWTPESDPVWLIDNGYWPMYYPEKPDRRMEWGFPSLGEGW